MADPRLMISVSGIRGRVGFGLTPEVFARYAAAFDEYCEAIRQDCMRQQTDYVSWKTDQPFEEMFLHLLSRGSALAKV